MSIDKSSSDERKRHSPATIIEEIFPDDQNDLSHVTRALNVATPGIVRVMTVDGTSERRLHRRWRHFSRARPSRPGHRHNRDRDSRSVLKHRAAVAGYLGPRIAEYRVRGGLAPAANFITLFSGGGIS